MKKILILCAMCSFVPAHTIEEKIEVDSRLQIKRLEESIKNSKNLEDVQFRQKYQDRLKSLKSEILARSEDYSKESMDRILRLALYNDSCDKVSEILIAHEIEHRPIEFKESVNNLLNQKNLQIEELNNLPYWASYISDEYQVIIAEKIMFHPSSIELGEKFLRMPNFIDYFRSDSESLRLVRDKLVEQKRIDAGGYI